ncbi:MAG: RagB/SusD family nutrient uptake outer membrane protein [Tannerella sp.]|nr:RagB/SusD family nutrient uptake outer membrane protein [Tannerella sp.]
MKKIINYIILFAITWNISCTDVLEQQAVDSFNEDVVFSDINLVKAYLGACYSMMGGRNTSGQANDGVLGLHRDMLTSATDQTLCPFRPQNYVHLKGTMSPDQLGFFASDNHGGWLRWMNLYNNIQNLNTILSRIDDVPVQTTAEESLRTRIKGETYFIRALMYTHLLMVHGGVVLSDTPYKLNEDFLSIKRSSIADTKDFILSDIAHAIEFLPPEMEQGRATRGAAGALKSRLLLFCSGKLMNGGYEPGNELVSFPAGSQTALLEAARDAAKDVMDGKYGSYALVGNTSEPVLPLTEAQIQEYAEVYFNIFNQKGVWNSETIWGIQFPLKDGRVNQVNLWNGPNGYHNYGNNEPTEPAVRSFEMADGTPFVWDAVDPGNDTLRTATAAELLDNPLRNPYNGREPRFYATVLYHGASWQERPADAKGFESNNRIQTGHIYNADGSIAQRGIDTRQGPIDDWNGTKTGYYMKKFMDPETVGQYYNNTNAWVEFRYAEILLNYAEACIELGDANLQSGLAALNQVRNRAGLPSRVTTDRETARTYVRHEREIEFFGEGHRFWDLRRWMLFGQVIRNVYGMKIKEYVNGDMEWKLDYNDNEDPRTWNGDRFYWLPLPRDEVNKAPQLQQNPGYN